MADNPWVGSGRPILDRLPGINEGFKRDPNADYYDATTDVANWVTTPWDQLLMDTKGKIDDFYTDYLNPDTALTVNLDWLAQLCGFTGEYWDPTYQESAKRSLIKNSFSYVWIYKGDRQLLEWLYATVFQLQVRVYILNEFLAGITLLPAPVGGEPFVYFLLVRLDYLRTSKEWALVDKLNRLYGPIWAESRVCYEQFYAGFSVANDPVFSYVAPEYGLILLEDGSHLLTESGLALSQDYTYGILATEALDAILTETGALIRIEDPSHLLTEDGFVLRTEDFNALTIESGGKSSRELITLLLENGTGGIKLEQGGYLIVDH